MEKKEINGIHLDKAVCEYIVKAQMCSDSGKDIWIDYHFPEWKEKAWYYGYGHKDLMIQKAIGRIHCLRKKGRQSGFFYSTSYDPRLFMNIVYFTFKLGGVRYQISFHTHCMRFGEGEGPQTKTRWDKKSSEDTCWVLAKYLKDLNGHSYP